MNGITDIFGSFFSGSGFRSCDAAALKVAMMVAALDGEIDVSEFAEFERLAKMCRGYSEENAAALFDGGIRLAGYIEIQSRRLTEKETVALFVREALDVLPPAFFRGELENIRRAFAMWTMIAMSDDYFAGIERKALDAMFASVTGAVEACGRYEGYATPLASIDKRFLVRVEGVVSRLKHEATECDARQELEQLIANHS